MSPGLRALFRAEPTTSRESTQLEFLLPDGASVPLLRVRDRRARRLRLTVTERGVRLSVPWRLAESVASAFVRDHAGWIAAQWQRLRVSEAPLAWAFGAVESLPLAGVEHRVAWIEARSARIEREADAAAPLHFHAPRAATAAALKRAVLEFYGSEARTAIHRWLPAYLPGLPRPPRDFRVRPLQSLWGSLAPDDRVSLDLSLALGPPEAFEYVLVHELCHLVHANHSAAFWREVDARCPDWRESRAFLRSDAGLGLKARLRRLSRG
jgi:predicted metal-dependent hydrolase